MSTQWACLDDSKKFFLVIITTILALGSNVAQAQWTDAGSYIYPNNAPLVAITDTGKFGIGLTSPLAHLHVNGGARFNVGEGLFFTADSNYWATDQDSRLIRMIDGNGTLGNVDGGMAFESFTTSDNVRIPLLTLRRTGHLTKIGIGSGYPLNLVSIHSSWTVGEGTLDSVAKAVYGVGTSFLTELAVGSEILVNGQARRVSNIVSDTELTLHVAFPSNLSGATFRYNNHLVSVLDNGFVGIGTSAPVAPLDVYGSIAVGGNEIIDENGSWVGAGSWVDLLTDQTIDGFKSFTKQVRANGGILSLNTLQVGDNTNSERIDIYSGNTAIDFYRVGGAKYGEISTNATNDFILRSSGGKFRIADDVHFRYSDSGTWRSLFAGDFVAYSKLALADSLGNIKGRFELSGSDTMFHNSQVGAFQVRTNIHSTGRNNQYLTFGATNATYISFERGSLTKDLTLKLGPTTDGTLQVQGNTQITKGLKVTGDLDLYANVILHPLRTGSSNGQVCYVATASGDYLIKCSSSQRFKTEVSSLTNGLEVVQKLRPVSYTWIENSQRDLGFIAEEVAEVEPLLATYGKDGFVEGVKYDHLTAVLVDAIQQQQKQIDELKMIVCLDHPGAGMCH